MNVLDNMNKKVEDYLDKVPDIAKDKAQKKFNKALKENTWGLVCIGLFKSKENQTRCKALTKLPGIAKDGVKAGASCTAAATAGGATVGSGGTASPVSVPATLIAGASCVYNGAKFVDGLDAFSETMRTGKEVKPRISEAKKAAGAWILKTVEEGAARQLREAAESDYRHNKAINGPDYTPADHNRLLDAQDHPFGEW